MTIWRWCWRSLAGDRRDVLTSVLERLDPGAYPPLGIPGLGGVAELAVAALDGPQLQRWDRGLGRDPAARVGVGGGGVHS